MTHVKRCVSVCNTTLLTDVSSDTVTKHTYLHYTCVTSKSTKFSPLEICLEMWVPCSLVLLLPPANLGQGNVFTHVCHSVHGSGLYDVTSCLATWCHVPSRGSLSLIPCSFQRGLCLEVLYPNGLSLGEGVSVGRPLPESEKQVVRILLESFLVESKIEEMT